MDAHWDWTTFAFIVVGILASVLVPIFWQAARASLPARGFSGFGALLWTAVRPYLLLGLASIATAPVIYAFGGATLDGHWQLALLAGYAWDSTLQKIVGKPA